jgi:hypothetical protein
MASKRKIYLNISEIASFIGKNPYDSVTPFERLWKKCDSEEYHKALNELNIKLLDSQLEVTNILEEKNVLESQLQSKKITKRQYTSKLKELDKKETQTKDIIQDISEKVDNIKLSKTEQVEKALGKDIVDKIKNANIDTDDKRNATTKLVESLNVSDEVKHKLKQTTENVINTTHGTLKEDSAISQFEKKFQVKLDTSQQYYSRYLHNISKNSKFDWFIGGKVDGLYIDNDNPQKNYVVEVKNRTKGFFNSLRDYEKCQIQLYIWMLNLEQAKLVEKYKDKIRITGILKDSDFIEDIMESLEIFSKNIEDDFLKNYKIKVEYLNKSNDDKKKFISKLYLSEIGRYLNTKFENRVIEKEAEEDCLLDDLD